MTLTLPDLGRCPACSGSSLRGVRLAFIGIDGIGKTTVSQALRGLLAGEGLSSQVVSWRLLVEAQTTVAGYPLTSLQQLWVEDWRLLYGGSRYEGRLVDADLPRTFASFQRLNVERTFPSVVSGARASGPMASALVEAAVDYIIEADVVRPLAERGIATIRESFGFKPTVKSLLIASRCAKGGIPDHAFQATKENLRAQYSNQFLQPDMGIFLDGPAELALDRKLRGDERIGPGEDYGIAGYDNSYLELQEECRTEFAAMAQEWGWCTLTVGDATPETLAAEIVSEMARRGLASGPCFACQSHSLSRQSQASPR